MQYSGTYSCGHDGIVHIIGPHKEREWKINYAFSHLCPTCEKIKRETQRNEENEIAAKKTAEMELPALSGSAKQITWANTIRVKFIEDFYRFLSENQGKTILSIQDENYWSNDRQIKVSIEILNLAFDHLIQEEISASKWINSRLDSFDTNLYKTYKKYMEWKNQESESELLQELEKENFKLTVKSENSCKSGIVILSGSDKEVTAKYVKDSDFIKIAKQESFRWDGTIWKHDIDEFTGSADDRAAALGNSLLAQGFAVQFANEVQLEKAISANFKKECFRKIKYNKSEDLLSISWQSGNQTIYDVAKKLPGAKYKKGRIYVSQSYYKEVEDFAQTLNFQFSAEALKKIELFKEKEAALTTANVKHIQQDLSDIDLIKKSLISGGVILEDLKDES